MPQLDVLSFTPQLVWLGISFIFIFFIFLKYILPDALGIFHMRKYLKKNKKIEGDFDTQSKVIRKKAIASFLKTNLISSLEVNVREDIKNKDINQLINIFDKRDFRASLISKISWGFLLLPNDSFILFSLFFIFFGGIYTFFKITAYLINVINNQILDQKISFKNFYSNQMINVIKQIQYISLNTTFYTDISLLIKSILSHINNVVDTSANISGFNSNIILKNTTLSDIALIDKPVVLSLFPEIQGK